MPQSNRRKPALVGTYQVLLVEKLVPYTLKRSSIAKCVRLEVRLNTGLSVIVPRSYKVEALPDLLKKKRRWILDKLAEYGKAQPIAVREELKSGDSIPYLGRQLKVMVQRTPGTDDSISLEQDRVLLNLNNGRFDLVLEWWYRQQAERLIKKKADELCPQLGVIYKRLCIRSARTRWGSCSRKGNLNFNWKLMMMPEAVIDYVIIHELAHLKEMNHSKKFWALVARHCPQWRQHRQYLHDHGVSLLQ